MCVCKWEEVEESDEPNAKPKENTTTMNVMVAISAAKGILTR